MLAFALFLNFILFLAERTFSHNINTIASVSPPTTLSISLTYSRHRNDVVKKEDKMCEKYFTMKNIETGGILYAAGAAGCWYK